MGKSSSKLKQRRSQSMSWSFRFNTNRKKIMSPIMISHPHLDIDQWLKTLDLEQYMGNLKKFNGVEELMYFCEADIKKLGVRNSAHRARIVTSLVALREKWERGISNNNNLNNINNNSNNGNLKRNGSTRRSNRFSAGIVESSNRKIIESNYELLAVGDKKTKQSKSLGDLIDEMETGGGSPSGLPNSPSQESQEALTLRKALEWELSLDSRDLKSHAWYHGPIPRIRAEEIVQKDGDFLIRDCTSQPGNYVLTCRAKGTCLHFVINKILIQPETVYERAQYQFEDDAYDTVPDLITFYVGSGKPISAASGAKIQYPCNRMYPLSFYASKYGAQMCGPRGASPLNSPANAGLRYNPYKEQGNYNSFRSPMSSPPRTKREIPPRLPSKKQRSQSLTPIQSQAQTNTNRGSQEKYCSADGVIQGNCTEVTSSQMRSSDSRRLLNMEKCGSADGVIQNSNDIMTRSAEENSINLDGTPYSPTQSQTMSRSVGDPLAGHKFSSLPRTPSGNIRQGLLGSSRTSSFNRDSSDPSLSPCLEQRNFEKDDENDAPSPPPKPARTPSMMRHEMKDQQQEHGPMHRVASYHASGSDSGNGSGDSAQSSAAGDPLEIVQHRGVVIKNPKYLTNSASSMTLKSFVEIDPIAVEESLQSMDIPIFEQISKYDLENFNTLLLPSIENKPLDNGALNTFRMMLSETGPRVIANHLTRVDIKLILGDLEFISLKYDASTSPVTPSERNPLESTGIELITLENGKQFRRDLIERTECLKLLVATTILTCQSDSERAETLNKWIQVAVDTKTALGNLFGFCSIMLGLCMPQIQRLESTWHMLRQKFTDSAFNFEAKLKPTLKSMNDCSNPQAPNTTVPHLLPYILLKDRAIEDIIGQSQSAPNTLITSCITPWETSASDFGITILLAHFDSARAFIKNLSLYKRNAQIILNDQSRLDDLLEEAFRTEFHIKFLWGSKGAFVSAEDRHAKFEQVLSVMAEKYCSGDQNNII